MTVIVCDLKSNKMCPLCLLEDFMITWISMACNHAVLAPYSCLAISCTDALIQFILFQCFLWYSKTTACLCRQCNADIAVFV